MTKRMSLPTDNSFVLPSGETIRFRPVCMYDYEWAYNNIGREIDEILGNFSVKDTQLLYRLFFQQIPDKDRMQYAVKEVRTRDENGSEEIVELGGYKLLMHKIGVNFSLAQRAYGTAIELGTPEKEEEGDEDGKKKLKKSES